MKRDAQIVLGPCPKLRQIGLCIDLEGGAESGHRVLEQLAAFFSGAARPEVVKRVAQIVLGQCQGQCPILRQIGPGPDLQGGAISGKRVLEQLAAFFSGAARPEVLRPRAGEITLRGDGVDPTVVSPAAILQQEHSFLRPNTKA